MFKDSFVFRKDWYIALKNLGDAARLEVYDAIMREVFEDGNVELSLEANVAMMFITPLIRRDVEKYNLVCERRKLAGSQGGMAKSIKCKQMPANGSKCKQMVASVADNDNDNDNDNDIHDTKVSMGIKEEDTSVSKKKPSNELEKEFDAFRLKYKEYGGKVRGFETEFLNFKNKHKDWKDVIPLLRDALEKENNERAQANARREFFPQMKNLQTYLNQRSWEAYYDESEKHDPNEYHPLTDGMFQVWMEKENYLRFDGQINSLNDGYTADTRPDGATVGWQMYRWVWSKDQKRWNKK